MALRIAGPSVSGSDVWTRTPARSAIISRKRDGRFGEFLAVAGCAAYLPTDGTNVRFHGFERRSDPRNKCLVRAPLRGSSRTCCVSGIHPFSGRVARRNSSHRDRSGQFFADIGMVIVAESGWPRRRRIAPFLARWNARFQYPEIRGWLSFSTERLYARSLPWSREWPRQILPVRSPRCCAHLAVPQILRTLSRFGFSYRPLPRGESIEIHGHRAVRIRKSARRPSSAHRRPPGSGSAAKRIRARRMLDQRRFGSSVQSSPTMSLLIGTFTIGFILSLLALGVFISFRIFAFPDITADGSITLGAAVAATLLVHGVSPPLASLAAFGAGLLAGTCTGTLHTRFRINSLLRNSRNDRAVLRQSSCTGAATSAAVREHSGHAPADLVSDRWRRFFQTRRLGRERDAAVPAIVCRRSPVRCFIFRAPTSAWPARHRRQRRWFAR